MLKAKALYEFGKFRCDPGEHLLLCEGKPVSLSPKDFEILVFLIRSRGRLLTKDELMRQVWPDSFVEEANLTVHISALRKALGETAEGQRYIETIPKHGYRFTAAVSETRNGKAGSEHASVAPEPGITSVAPVTVRPRRIGFRLLAIGLGVLVIVCAALLFILRRHPRLTDKDTVVLAELTNTTGDSVFDGALRQGLSSQLEQSPYLNLLSEERIAQTLSLMARPRDSRLTHDLAREVCQRTGSAAVLDGTIAQVGTQYQLTLKATDCSNGDSLGSAQEDAADKNHVLEALGKAASNMRNQLGESLASVQKYDAPPESVTTASLEALKAYNLGYRALVLKSDYASAIPLFQRAINLDPNFAMAYARLGTSYSNIFQTADAAIYARKAFELKDRASEREKLYIASHYQLLVTGNLEEARKIYELSAQTYPHDIPLNNLGMIYSELGDFDKALEAYQKVLRVSAGTGNRYANLVSGFLQLNRLEEAKAAAREAQSLNLDSPDLHLNLYWVHFVEHDSSGMAVEAAELIGRPGHEDRFYNYEADAALYSGQLIKARALAERAMDAARKAEEKEAVALYRSASAVREALVGNMEVAKQQARAALASSNARDVEGFCAIALEMAGDSAEAHRLAADLERRFPEDTIVQKHYVPAVRIASLLRSDGSARAQQTLHSALSDELGGNLETVNFVLYPVYLRGEAFLAARRGQDAAIEFQKILAHPGAIRTEPIGALAHLQLGRALALSGDTAKAKTEYETFLTLWKDADTDLPVLKEAKAEYSSLH